MRVLAPRKTFAAAFALTHAVIIARRVFADLTRRKSADCLLTEPAVLDPRPQETQLTRLTRATTIGHCRNAQT